jgi:hypothetical protein
MSVNVKTEGNFEASVPRPLFQTRVQNYDVSPDGERFLFFGMPNREANTSQLTVITNWTALLKRSVK